MAPRFALHDEDMFNTLEQQFLNYEDAGPFNLMCLFGESLEQKTRSTKTTPIQIQSRYRTAGPIRRALCDSKEGFKNIVMFSEFGFMCVLMWPVFS